MASISESPSSDYRAAITVQPLREGDLDTADRIMRIAFGTFLGLPDPLQFLGDANYVHTRWRARPEGAFGAMVDGKLVGSNFASRWGRVGFFGPLTVLPEFWNGGIGRALMNPIMECFERWRCTHTGLFTFAQSVKHVGLYRSFGYWPRFLTAIMSKPVEAASIQVDWCALSSLPPSRRALAITNCSKLSNELYEGLDLSDEIETLAQQSLGDVVLLGDETAIHGFAVCHCGPGTEAGGGVCYVKFGAVRSTPSGATSFMKLLQATESFASSKGLTRVSAGTNTARHGAYRALLEIGFRTDIQGVAMHRHNEEGYCRPDLYVLDDWR